ncbi:hypothetical protein QQF64_015615 [Cirrhinus molitorella]|uniref:Ig-like domain-containing protein n=1 Tax=Cirrhinus molitorella TaxID=172907 RepID=A0ABR3NVS7_9TELE
MRRPQTLDVTAPDLSVVHSSVSGHEGGNISVQCLYSSGYQKKVKQWCRYKDKSCYTVGRTDTSQNSSVQITDDDERRSFTVLMTGLRLTDSGWYFCSVGDRQVPVQLTITEDPQVPVLTLTKPKPGRYQTFRGQPYLRIQCAPDVSVVSSSVSGHEGGDISVQCLYSSAYQNKVKQWCRYKDRSCYTVGRTDTSQNSSVLISDDIGKRSFTVLMTGLRLTDSGWYFCSAGDLQISVQLTMSAAVTTTTVKLRYRKRNLHNGRIRKDENILHFNQVLVHVRC